jgi:Na+/melibiose symporter-like transporter
MSRGRLPLEAAATRLYVPYSACTPVLTSDDDERALLTSYRMFVSMLGSLPAFAVLRFIIDSFHPKARRACW